jgi:hypothetical protein
MLQSIEPSVTMLVIMSYLGMWLAALSVSTAL